MTDLKSNMPKLIYSLIDSPTHPNLTAVYESLGMQEKRFPAMRKAISALKKEQPDIVVGQFFYGYGNNYAGANISNLDVFLHSLQKYAPAAKVIVMVSKDEVQFIDKLKELFEIAAVLVMPVFAEDMQQALEDLI